MKLYVPLFGSTEYIANDVAFLTQCLVFVESAKPDGIIKLLELRLDIGHEDSSAPIVALSIHFHDKSSTYFTVPTKMRSNQLPVLALANDPAWGVRGGIFTRPPIDTVP
jgi:hypothetical protein